MLLEQQTFGKIGCTALGSFPRSGALARSPGPGQCVWVLEQGLTEDLSWGIFELF